MNEEGVIMMYPFLTIDDSVEHSEKGRFEQ